MKMLSWGKVIPQTTRCELHQIYLQRFGEQPEHQQFHLSEVLTHSDLLNRKKTHISFVEPRAACPSLPCPASSPAVPY